MSEFSPEGHVENQRLEWNSVANGWEKWDRWMDRTLSFFDKLIVERAGITEGRRALDLGSGTGYPAIRAASVTGASGEVIGLDIAEQMLEVARSKSGNLGLAHLSFKACDVGALPFEDASFDAVISRFCLMFLPDVPKTLGEVHRVLRPGSRFAAGVWAEPEKNLGFTLPMGIIREVAALPAPDPTQPGVFSLGQPGALVQKFEEAGFSGAREEEVAINFVYESEEEYMNGLTELAAPIKAVFAKLSAEQKSEAEKRISEAIRPYYSEEGSIVFKCAALMVSGARGEA